MSDRLEQTFPVECNGRDRKGGGVLTTPVQVRVTVSRSSGTNVLESQVECPYNAGGHGQRCKASHPEQDKVGEGIACAYAFTIPHVIDENYYGGKD